LAGALTVTRDKQSIARPEFVANVAITLQPLQDGLFERAKSYRDQHTRSIDTREAFYAFFTSEREQDNEPAPIHGGFALTHFSGDIELEHKIKDDLSVTVRCIPLAKSEPGTCPFTGKPSAQRVVWGKAY
jgi:prolyl-tRNA synthetase